MQPSNAPAAPATDDSTHKPSYDSEYTNGTNGHAARDPEKQEERRREHRPSYQEARRRSSWANKEDPFGDEEGAEVKYRTLRWWQAAFIMIAETISLGILSLPSVLASIGMVPGIILIVGLGVLATYTGFVLGQFKLAYPHVSLPPGL